MLVELILSVLAGFGSNEVARAFDLALSQFQPPTDLRAAVNEAFTLAIARLASRASTKAEKVVLEQVKAYAVALFPVGPEDAPYFPRDIMTALVKGDVEEARRGLRERIAGQLQNLPTDRVNDLEMEISSSFVSAFGETLQKDKYRSAWVGFQQIALRSLLRSLQAGSPVPDDPTHKDRAEALGLLKAAAVVPDQLAASTARILAAVDRGSAALQGERDEQAVVLRAILASVESLRQLSSGSFTNSSEVVGYRRQQHDDELVDSLVVEKTYVGRETTMQEWIERVSAGGYFLVTAPAGGGKSTFLAHCLRVLQRRNGTSPVCYHFFSAKRGTNRLDEGIACLSEQLLRSHNIIGVVRESENSLLRAILFQTLEMRHPYDLIVIVDGIDEIFNQAQMDQPFPLPAGWFPRDLGEGTSVVFAIRSMEGEHTLDGVRQWLGLPDLTHLPLPALDQQAVHDLLRQSSSTPLRSRASDAAFVKRVLKRTHGLPIYLQYLTQDLEKKDEQEWDAIVEALPPAFSDWTRIQIARAIADRPNWRDAMRYLALAKGPLANEDLLRLTELSKHRLDPEDLDAVPWPVSRWLERSGGHWSFQHPVFADVYIDSYLLNERSQEFILHLIEYCSDWKRHHSQYAMRYYAEHLHDTLKRTELYALTRDREFSEVQRKFVSNEPMLGLTTARDTLQAAADADQAVEMAEFALLSAKRFVETRAQSPLQFLRAEGLNGAQALADLQDPEKAVLWYLLLAWELVETGRIVEAHNLLGRLLRGGVPLLTGWNAEMGVYLLAELRTVDPDKLVELGTSCIGGGHRGLLCYRLAHNGRPDVARRLTVDIDDVYTRINVWLEIARATKAKQDFEVILMLAPELEGDYRQYDVLRATALSQAQAGYFAQAVQTVARISSRLERARVLISLARDRVEADDVGAARPLLTRAMRLAVRYTRHWPYESGEWEQIKPYIVDIWLQAGDWRGAFAAARKIYSIPHRDEVLCKVVVEQTKDDRLDAALHTASQIAGSFDRLNALLSIAGWQASQGLHESARACRLHALQLAAHIESLSYQAIALAQIAEICFEMNDALEAVTVLAEAIAVARGVRDPHSRSESLVEIARVLQKVGNTNAALEIVQEIESGDLQDKALGVIAYGQAERGEEELALATALRIKEADWKEWLWNSIIARHLQADDIRGALEVSEQTQSDATIVATIKDIMLRLVNGWQAKDAQSIIDAAIAIAQRRQNQSAGLEILLPVAQAESRVSGLGRARDIVESALQIAQRWDVASARLHQIYALLDTSEAQANLGATEASRDTLAVACELAEGIDENAPSSPKWRIAAIQCMTGDIPLAMGRLGLPPRAIANAEYDEALSDLVYYCAQLGHMATASTITDAVSSPSFKALALAGIAWQHLSCGQFGTLSTVANQIAELNLAEFEIPPALLDGSDDGDFEQVLKQRAESQMPIAFLAYLAGKFDIGRAELADAQATTEQIASDYIRARLEQDFVQVLVAFERDKALQLAKQIEDDEPRIEACCLVALAQWHANETAAAAETVLSELARFDPQKGARVVWSNVELLTRLAQTLAQIGRMERAQEAFSAAKALITDSEEDAKAHALSILGRAQVLAGFFEQAMRTSEEIHVKRVQYVPPIAEAFIDKADKVHFKQLLVSSTSDPDTLYRLCGLLARMYPENATQIGDLLRREILAFPRGD